MKKKLLLLPLIGLLAFSLSACSTKGDTGPQGPQGEQGIPGENGQDGVDGQDGQNGVDGKDGTSVITGNGAPSNTLGQDADSYIDLDTWDYYVKENGSWVLKGNIKGQDGQDGQNGQDGTNGQDGENGQDGVNGQDGTSVRTGNGTPSNELGNDGDTYIDLDTWNLYVKENGSWILKGNIKGNDGNNGQDAIQYIPAIFNNYDGSMLYTFYYEKGSDIVYDGPEPTREGYFLDGEHYAYEFTGWDKSLNNIQTPTVFTAQYNLRNDTEEYNIAHGIIPDISEDGKTVTYGLYPQTSIDDPSLASALNALTSSTTPESNGWYLYKDEYYAKVSAAPYDSSYVFDNGTTIVSGTTYWFKCEPIVWNVLPNNDGEYYLLSSVLLDTHCYYNSASSRTIDGQTVFANNYEYSDIRAWLNGDFYNSAFALNNSYIQTTTVDNSAATTDSSSNFYACSNTQDKVFLPSYQDYLNEDYGFENNGSYTKSATRECKTTDWARARGVYCSTDSSYLYNGRYWTRSPSGGGYSYNAWDVDYDGYLDDNHVYSTDKSVRPAITINL